MNKTCNDQLAKQELLKIRVQLSNNHLNAKDDYLFHLGLPTDDTLKRFNDVKFVCMGGKQSRMKSFAELLYKVLGQPKNCEFEEDNKNLIESQLKDISESGGRYCVYKVGPVLSASHGIGSPSMSVVLHELQKLTFYAGCADVKFIRLGTSGGLGVDPGTLVITRQSYSGLLEPEYKQIACGKVIKCGTKTDPGLTQQLVECAKAIGVKVEVGNTITANDFFEEQCRLDGALCSFTHEDKMEFLHRANQEHGILNMEMESACFTAMCNRNNIPCAVLCICLINRLFGDQVTHDAATLKRWENHPVEVAAELIKRSIN